jgi:hypothetical protein
MSDGEDLEPTSAVIELVLSTVSRPKYPRHFDALVRLPVARARFSRSGKFEA